MVVASGVRAAPRQCECLFSPRAVPRRVFAHQFRKSGELYHLRGLRIRPGGVRGRFSARLGCGLPSPIRSGDSGFSAGLTTAYELSPRGPSSRTLRVHPVIPRRRVRHSSGNIGAGARCRPLPVRQFRGKCPLPSVTSPAILGQVPTAVLHQSGNFGTSAHCLPSLVRQFRGRYPLLPVTRQAISGQVPIAVRFRLHSCYIVYSLITFLSDVFRHRSGSVRYRSGTVSGSAPVCLVCNHSLPPNPLAVRFDVRFYCQ